MIRRAWRRLVRYLAYTDGITATAQTATAHAVVIEELLSAGE